MVEVRRPPVESKEEAHACVGAQRGRGVFRCGCVGCWAICLCMCSKPGCGRGVCVCVYSRCMVGRERNITHLCQCVCVSAMIWASVMSVFGL